MNDKPKLDLTKTPPLPVDRASLVAQRKLASKPTLNDLVEEIHLQLYEDQTYQDLLWAVVDSQAVEGSLGEDDSAAARLIRQQAKKIGSRVQNEKLHSIVIALRLVMRRYDESRKQRRRMMAGERVPDDNGNE